MKVRSPTLSGLLTLLALGTAGIAARHAEAARQSEPRVAGSHQQVTFDRDIAPIIFRNCSECHHPGESGPFPLLTYLDVKSHGRQIAYMTSKRIMPPWLPNPGEPKFAGELRLTDAQIATIQKWVDEGELQGNPADLPPQPKFAVGWELGKPDVIVRAEKPYHMLNIPAGDKNSLVSDDFTLPVDISALAIYPHARYLGKDLLAYATLPDGTRKTLIHISNWDLNWQAVYHYAQPIGLPAGTKISMCFAYDNSEDNIRNPNDPPIRVMGGNRAVDEMAHLWLQVLPQESQKASIDPRVTIEEALAHHIQNDPGDFEAHYNLAAILRMKGDLPGAVGQFQEAVRLQPDDPTANNALGGMLLASGRTDDAITRLNTALKARPEYFDAHYNLGNALAAKGDFPGALAQFRAAVRLNPQDAGAEANLGSALAEVGNVKEARLRFERGLQIDQKNEVALENLEQLNRDAPGRPN